LHDCGSAAADRQVSAAGRDVDEVEYHHTEGRWQMTGDYPGPGCAEFSDRIEMVACGGRRAACGNPPR